MTKDGLIAEIDSILPQTQCRQCGFGGCRPYATAIAEGRADINQCPPGGERGILKLARLLGVNPKPLNPDHGIEKPRAVAFIEEQACIGCTLCILACPVDAIVGAAKQVHTVISEACTGCELCVAPCPVDCISMVPPGVSASGEYPETHVTARGYLTDDDEREAADRARARHQFRLQRLEREKQEREGKLMQKTGEEKPAGVSPPNDDRKRAAVQAALERATAARSARALTNQGNSGTAR